MGNFGGQISDTHPICGGVLQLLLLEIGLVVTITLIIIVTIIRGPPRGTAGAPLVLGTLL